MQKILIAEDDQFLSKIYKIKLEKAGYSVVIALDGNQAIEEISKSLPDLILLDLMMPIKDGFATLEEIKKNPRWSKIPVLVASNLGQAEDINRAKKLGADDFIIKSDTSLSDIVVKIVSFLGSSS